MAAIRTKTEPSNVELTAPVKGSSETDTTIRQEDYLKFKQKERIWTQTNQRILNMILG